MFGQVLLVMTFMASSLTPLLVPPVPPGGRAGAPTYDRWEVHLSLLAIRLHSAPTAVTRNDDGRAIAIFGLDPSEARVLLLPVTPERGLPDDYVPPDLTTASGARVRAVLANDLRQMIAAAANDGVEIAVVSAYRSPAQQTMAFESALWRELAQARGQATVADADLEEAERAGAEARVSRLVALPGHSQHQLGTALDLSNWTMGYALQPRFAETAAGAWLEAHAWEYGFVQPYPRHGEARTGYAYEPWHYRWIGRDLAALLAQDDYLHREDLVVDDYLSAAEEVLDAEAGP
ncbi:MAG: M15 family metallopeptidase [Chloroflexi bacterium]|nr:M15 family metallopeptidase [Chloroflexota bacterium]